MESIHEIMMINSTSVIKKLIEKVHLILVVSENLTLEFYDQKNYWLSISDEK